MKDFNKRAIFGVVLGGMVISSTTLILSESDSRGSWIWLALLVHGITFLVVTFYIATIFSRQDTKNKPSGHIAVLESQVNMIWGRSIFDWVIGRTVTKDGSIKNVEDHVWFWYCGERSVGDTDRKQWRHKGYARDIESALQAMIDLGEKVKDQEAVDET